MHLTPLLLGVSPHAVSEQRGGCARVIECNLSSSAHHRVCTFFPSPFNPVGKGSGHAQTTRDMAERQSPDGNKRPRGTPRGWVCIFFGPDRTVGPGYTDQVHPQYFAH